MLELTDSVFFNGNVLSLYLSQVLNMITLVFSPTITTGGFSTIQIYSAVSVLLCIVTLDRPRVFETNVGLIHTAMQTTLFLLMHL